MTPPRLRRSGSRAGRRLAAIVLLALVATSTGCGGDPNRDGDPFNDDPGKEGTVKLDDRPPMETILEQYRSFQTDLFDQLARMIEDKVWEPIDGMDAISGAGCNDDLPVEWGTAGLPDMAFDGTYPPADWHRVRDLVIAVGKKHGFTEIETMSDVPGNLDFFGTDPRYGGRYEFGMGNNTIFGIETGCHRWDELPSPSATP